jgi:membrane protein implicated in regulation of membrane protease activity
MALNILWWQWLLFGLVLMAAELASPGGFYIIFFGIAAVAVGLLDGAGMAGGTTTQIALFAVLAVMTLVVFRSRLLRWFQADPQRPAVDQLVGEVGVAGEDLPPGQVGRVELRGTAWSARNGSTVIVARGGRVRVTGVEGLTLDVEPEGAR